MSSGSAVPGGHGRGLQARRSAYGAERTRGKPARGWKPSRPWRDATQTPAQIASTWLILANPSRIDAETGTERLQKRYDGLVPTPHKRPTKTIAQAATGALNHKVRDRYLVFVVVPRASGAESTHSEPTRAAREPSGASLSSGRAR